LKDPALKYLLDTKVVAALIRPEPIAGQRLLVLGPDQIFMAQPVISEINYGLARLAPSEKKIELNDRFNLLRKAVRRAEWDDTVSATFGELKGQLERQGKRLADLDIAVAAHAIAVGGVLVTAKSRRFDGIEGLDVEDWLA